MSEWKPIETAPRGEPDGRDGPDFLAYQNGMMGVGHFTQWSEREKPSFYLSHVSGWEYDLDIDKPTHWMPLPPPPSSS